jgi:hypothetical protein
MFPSKVLNQGFEEQVPKNRFARRVPRTSFFRKVPNNRLRARFPGTGSQASFQSNVPKKGFQAQVSKNSFVSEVLENRLTGKVVKQGSQEQVVHVTRNSFPRTTSKQFFEEQLQYKNRIPCKIPGQIFKQGSQVTVTENRFPRKVRMNKCQARFASTFCRNRPGPGTGDTKMHGPKNRNFAGTFRCWVAKLG